MSLDAKPRRSMRAIFIEALERDEGTERQSYLAQACGDDAALRAEVDRLLRAHECDRASPLDVAVDQLAFATTSCDPAAANASLAFDRIEVQQELVKHPVIDSYKILEPLGEGGMGIVYVAEQLEPVRRKVALKIIKPGLDSQQVVARFEAERQALALMSHPNIAQVLDGGTTDSGRPYVVMELVRGLPINEYCDKHRLSVRQRLELFVTVCQAVQHAHVKGIIHRDLKPSNVLVELHDVTPVPKIIDFGIAKATNQQLTDQTLFTQYLQFLGTPLYMSPEQAELSGLDLDTRSDVYSLGVMLYELLTGRTPIDREALRTSGTEGVRRMINELELQRPSLRVSTYRADELSTLSERRGIEALRFKQALHGELDWIVMRALEKDRRCRYQSALELADDIVRHLNGEAVEAGPPSAAYRIRKTLSRHRTAAVVTLLVGLSLLTGLGASLWQARAATRARKLADQRLAEVQAAAERVQTLLYASNMKQASDALHQHDVALAIQLLKQHEHPGEGLDLRGFECSYMNQLTDIQPAREVVPATEIAAVRCDPEGRRFAALLRNGTVVVYARDSAPPIAQLRFDTHLPNSLAFSRDGGRLAIAGSDGVVLLYDFDSRSTQRISAHQDEVNDVVFIDDNTLASCSDDDTIRLWDLRSLKRLETLEGHGREVEQLAVSPDRTLLASASSDRTAAVWDLSTLRRVQTLTADQGRVVCVAFSSDGKTLAAGTITGHLLIADVDAGSFRILGRQLDGVEALTFFDDDRWLAAGDRSGTIRLWPPSSTEGSEQQDTFWRSPQWSAHHEKNIHSLRVAGDNLLVSASLGSLKLWKPDIDRTRREFVSEESRVLDISLRPRQLIAAATSEAQLWSVPESRLLQRFPNVPTPCRSVAVSQRGDFLAACSHEKLALLDLDTGRELAHYQLDMDAGWRRIEFSPNGEYVALRYWDTLDVVKLLHTPSLDNVQLFPATQCACIAFSPDSRRLAVGDGDDVVVYRIADGTRLLRLTGHSSTLSEVAFSPDGTLLASVSHDRRLKVWDAHTGQLRHSIVAHRDRIFAVAFSPDGRTVATGGADDVVRLWHVKTGLPLLELPREKGSIDELAFSTDGKQLVALHSAGGFVIYDAAPAMNMSRSTNDSVAAASTRSETSDARLD